MKYVVILGDGMADVDAALLVVEAAPKFGLENGLPPAERELISELRRRKLKAVLAINKIDMLERKEELITDQPERVMVAEMIREKLLRMLDKEVPHGIAIDLERFVERDTADGEPILDVEATVICEKESHKGIIIGKGGANLKKAGMLARRDIEEFFGIRASVKLWVKVKEDWRNRQGLIHTFGLD